MGKKKDLKKLTPLGRMGRLWRESQQRVRELEAKLTYEQARYAENARRNDNMLTDKNATIARQEDLLQRARADTAAAITERDRIMRLCDQFLSVQIIGHGQKLTGAESMSNTVSPGNLRRT